MVRGDVDAVLVSEFSLANGCILVEFDSITRNFPTLDTLPKRNDANASPSSSAATLHVRTFIPNLDSAATSKCSKLRTLRRIDPIPRAIVESTLVGTNYWAGVVIPVSLDSLAVCMDGTCSRHSAANIDNRPSNCLIGMYAPQRRDTALSITRSLLQSAEEVVTLQRRLFIIFSPPLPCIVRPNPIVLARATALLPEPQKETRFAFPNSNVSPAGRLPPLASWSDPRVTADLARPSPSNAGDYFTAETLDFSVTRLRTGANSTKDSIFRYVSGIKYYQYQGFQSASGCDTAPAPTIVGDTLKLDGASLQISNDGCGRRDIGGFSNNFDRWLFAPRSARWQSEFMKGSMLDNGPSFPFVGDSVQAFGWKFSLEELMGTGPSHSAPRETYGFAVALSGRSLSILLEQASPVRIISSSGQILISRDLPTGKSEIALPSGTHGLLLVGVGNRYERILAP